MKQSLPMPVVIGVVAVVLILAVVFLMKRSGSNNDYGSKEEIMNMQKQKIQGNGGHTPPTTIPARH